MINPPTLPIPCSCCIQNPNIFTMNQHLMTDYQVKKEATTEGAVIRSRWNPAPQQIQALEEIYRRGIRTPSADQIQQIAAKLRRFGKIEEKNVFYWFQNHKARERQKRRRHLELLSRPKIHATDETLEAKQTKVINGRDLEIEHANAKKLASPSNCSTLSEDSLLIRQRELHQTTTENQETWPLDLYSFVSPNKRFTTKEENSKPFGDIKLSMSLLPSKNDDLINILGNEGNQTLKLFPIRSNATTKEDIIGDSSLESKISPNKFFEFLPPKN